MSTTTSARIHPDDTDSRSRVAWIASVLAAITSILVIAGLVISPEMANAQPAAYLSGHNPAGDVSFAVYGNHVHVFGYAYDIDSWEPVNVVYYVNGAPRAEQRTDYGYIERTFRLPYGTTELRVVARNIGLGASDTVIGSRVFQLFDPATRNPRGFARITHYHRRLHVRGFTVDPDRLTWPLLVRVFDNGRLIAATRADPSTHLYTMTARLHSGVNRIQVVSYNIGLGTGNHVNARATFRIRHRHHPP